MGAAVEWVIYTESAIDLLSFYQLKKDKLSNALLVSMGGLKAVVVENYKSLYPQAKHCLAVDDDTKGNEFADEYKGKLYRKKPDEPFKDWNELLCSSKS